MDVLFTIAEWRGGPPDDLSGISYTPGIAYVAIQDIFTVTETSPGVLSFTDTTTASGARFYRFGVSED